MHAGLEFAASEKSFLRRWITPITASVLLLALTTFALWIADAGLRSEHLIFIYFVPTALIAVRYGSVSAMLVTIGSTFVGAYYLYAPRFSFFVDSPLDMIELALFGMLALLASQVVSGFASDRVVVRRRQPAGIQPTRMRWPSVPSLWTRNRG